MSSISGSSRFSPEGLTLRKIDRADGKQDGLITREGIKNFGADNISANKHLSGEIKEVLSLVESGQNEDVSLKFKEGHDNDITVLSATRRGENAVTWLSPTIIKNWEEGEPIDAVIEKVSRLAKHGKTTHHPALFVSKDAHEPVNNHHSLVFANSDYNKDGKVSVISSIVDGDLPAVVKEGKNLEKAYKEHGYDTTLHENFNDNEIKAAVLDKIEQAEAGDEIVVHYSGHGFSGGISGVSGSFLGQNINPFQDMLFNSEIQDLVIKAKDKGVKLVMLLDSCESGYTTDFIAHKEFKGLEKLVNDLDDKALNPDEKTVLHEAKNNLKQIKTLIKEIDDLHDKPINIEVDGKNKAVTIDDLQGFLGKTYDKTYTDKDDDAEFKLSRKKLHIDLDISSTEMKKNRVELQAVLGKITPEAKTTQLAELEQKISQLKEDRQQVMAELKVYEGRKNEAKVKIEHINEVADQRFGEILTKEKALNSLMQNTYNDLSMLSTYNPQSANVGLNKFDFDVGAIATPQQGPMVKLGVNYNLFELNRFSDMGFKFSAGIGQGSLRVSEAFSMNMRKNLDLNFGLAQSYVANDRLRNWLSIGVDYQIGSRINLNTGVDLGGGQESKLKRFNPYVGIGIKL